MGKITYKKGFTLIELLISISIFSVFLIVASNSFVEIIRAQKTANETRLIYSELRDFVDLVDNQMREGGIDYFCYNQDFLQEVDFTATSLARCDAGSTLTADSGDNLRTISRDGLTSSIIKFVPAAAGYVDGTSSTPAADGTGGGVFQLRFRNVNGSWVREAGYENDYLPLDFLNLKINSLRFEIYPKENPQSAAAQKKLETQIQPMVRMYLDVGSKIPNVPFDLKFQTSLTARNN